MSDYRTKLVNSIEASLLTVVDPQTREKVMRKVMVVLNDYEVTERVTDLVAYDDTNTRIINRYCACLKVNGMSPKTIYQYRRLLERFADFICNQPMVEVGVYEIRCYLATEMERVSEATVENTRSYLSSFYQWLTVEELIQKNPCAAIKPIKCEKKEMKAFNAVEMDAIRFACRTQKERAIVEVLASSGVRADELCSLDVSDIDFSEKVVHVRCGKGKKSRQTYIDDVAKTHLLMYLRSRPENCEALFCNYQHKRLCTGGLRVILNTIAERAEVLKVHPHRFRRTLATNLAKSGMPIQEIQRILGHSNINTTMRYVCLDDTQVQVSYRKHIA